MTRALFSFCNDCDFMSRSGFEEVHEHLLSLGIPAGDSFWLFDPSGGDMGLFTHDVDHPGPQHAWLLDQINNGTLDVLHSAGSYGERFNRGYRPNRAQIERALAYLAKHARVPRVWTNHGDVHNVQNIGGRVPSEHHGGDRPDAPAYCLDLLRAHGVTYFWLDRLVIRDPMQPSRLTAAEVGRDGTEFMTFARYLSPRVAWSPNAQNFAEQLDERELTALLEHAQNIVLYTHWGCHHTGHEAYTPGPPVLPPSSRDALQAFAEFARRSGLEIVRLEAALDESTRRPLAQEIQRIGAIVVESEAGNPDAFYFNQYHKHGLEYFARRIDGMGVSGRRALDAGSGVGQWSFALRTHFAEVCGIEINPVPNAYVRHITEALRSTDGPAFAQGSIEHLPYGDRVFDFILCYGALFVTNVRRTLSEFSRVLQPGGQVYVCMNGDGWYEYLCDDRFKDRSVDEVLAFGEPIWNALVARVGGAAAFEHSCGVKLRNARPEFWRDASEIRRGFTEAFVSPAMDLPALMASYSDRVVLALGRLTERHLSSAQGKRSAEQGRRSRWFGRLGARDSAPPPAVDRFPETGIGSTNRPFAPSEFADLAARHGLTMVASGPDASLSTRGGPIRPIYDGTFNGHDAVWECLLTK